MPQFTDSASLFVQPNMLNCATLVSTTLWTMVFRLILTTHTSGFITTIFLTVLKVLTQTRSRVTVPWTLRNQHTVQFLTTTTGTAESVIFLMLLRLQTVPTTFLTTTTGMTTQTAAIRVSVTQLPFTYTTTTTTVTQNTVLV